MRIPVNVKILVAGGNAATSTALLIKATTPPVTASRSGSRAAIAVAEIRRTERGPTHFGEDKKRTWKVLRERHPPQLAAVASTSPATKGAASTKEEEILPPRHVKGKALQLA